jgi:cell division protein FtsB
LKSPTLVVVLVIGAFLAYNSFKKILTFRETAKTVETAQERLDRLKKENEALKKELEYKSSDEFAEGEIRNKLGLAREDETVLILPKEQDNQQSTINNQQI